jgi:hypothetical protein
MTRINRVLDQRFIFIFWLPLFASWLLMTSEGPIISAVINRLPDEVVMLAAQGIVTSLSVTIESPIINLLATSTALTRNRKSYLLIRRFTIHWMILLTLVTALLGFTPLFDVIVLKIMGIPEGVAYWVRIGLRIMLLWSAAIAWRRFQQGVMIRYGHTQKVAWGTAVRLTGSAGTVILLAAATDFEGVIIGSTALMTGVIAEAIYATLAVRPILREHLSSDAEDKAEDELTYSELFWFHLPLAATSLLILLVQPMVSISLSRSPTPTLALATWAIVFQIMLVMRAPAFALPEVVIALTDGKVTFSPLKRFTLSLAAVNSLIMVLLAATPLLNVYLFGIQDTTAEIATMAKLGVILFIPLPGITVFISWIRGLLIDSRATRIVNAGMAINLVVSAAVLLLGARYHWPGISSAAIALTLAAAAELAFLWWRVGSVLEFPFRIIDSARSTAVGA